MDSTARRWEFPAGRCWPIPALRRSGRQGGLWAVRRSCEGCLPARGPPSARPADGVVDATGPTVSPPASPTTSGSPRSRVRPAAVDPCMPWPAPDRSHQRTPRGCSGAPQLRRWHARTTLHALNGDRPCWAEDDPFARRHRCGRAKRQWGVSSPGSWRARAGRRWATGSRARRGCAAWTCPATPAPGAHPAAAHSSPPWG